MSLSPLGHKLNSETPFTAREDSLALLTTGAGAVLTTDLGIAVCFDRLLN